MKQEWKKRIVVFAGASTATAFLAVVLSYLLCTPPLQEAEVYPSGVILRDRSGGLMRVGLGPDDSDCRPFYTASRDDWVVKALVASEDGRFYDHHGVCLKSVIRAVWQDVSSFRRISGASTLTMQAVRLIKPHPRSLFWKWIEAFAALRMERVRSKEWILSQYLNRAPFASNLVGVEAASQGWFGKPAAELSLGEAALLAGMVQSPSRFRPDRRLPNALRRREYVFRRMLELGYATEAEIQSANRAPIELMRSPRPFLEPFFCDWAASEIDETSGDYTTTLDRRIQDIVTRQVQRQAKQLDCSVAAVVIEVATGAVRALTCSGTYFDAKSGQVNTALSPRPAGSTLKPFILAKALDTGMVSPSELVADVPRRYGNFTPVNFNRVFHGILPIRDALILSLNIPFLDLVKKCSKEDVNAVLREAGLTTIPEDPGKHGLGIAVGNVDVRLLDLANAYATFARHGVYKSYRFLEKDRQNRELNERRIFSDEASWLIGDFLSGEERSAHSIGHIADAKLPKIAWKTGTSSAYRDAWTAAWTPDYVVAVWCGHKIGKFGDKRLVGAKVAAPVAWNIFRDLLRGKDPTWPVRPEGIGTRAVCSVSGFPPNGDCPGTREGLFLKRASSPRLCPVHRRDFEGKLETVWPPDVAAFLKERGKSDTTPAKESRLAILQPADRSVYKWLKGIPGQAVTVKPANVAPGERVWWYVDGIPHGETEGDEMFLLEDGEITLGDHTISCATLHQRASIHIRLER
ncbi:MAG: penicillin-binding protein 1C [Kiritimatiellae bacterium]|nr:penicillin-binding protein 1C [Kiritimatiellia bacterium]